MKTIVRISLCALLALSCFVTVGCSESKAPAPSTTSGADGGSDSTPAAGADEATSEDTE